MSILSDKTIEFALKDEGVHEIGNTNSGPIINKMQAIVHMSPGNPWCCAAACYWIDLAAKELNIIPEIKFHASVYGFWHDSNNQKLIIPNFEPGCLILRDEGLNSAGHAIGHLMIGIKDNKDGTFQCISGNTTSFDPNARTGGCVAVQNRPFSQLINGYGYMLIQ